MQKNGKQKCPTFDANTQNKAQIPRVLVPEAARKKNAAPEITLW
jgi:hypothetical protein